MAIMNINKYFLPCLALLIASPAFAQTEKIDAENHGHVHLGQGEIFPFHSFTLKGDYGDSTSRWDLDGWAGNDYNKLWLKSEGEAEDGKISQADIWALYSRNVATFWDAQLGLRYQPEIKHSQQRESTYAAFGVNGLAPLFFETEAYGMVRDDGLVKLHLKQENDLLLTNRLILTPSIGLDFNANKDIKTFEGSGLSQGEFKLQLRYELKREFSPYIEYGTERKFGKTADLYKAANEKTAETGWRAGIQLKF